METIKAKRNPWQFSLRMLFAGVTIVALLFGALMGYIHWLYPYGNSHCCDLILKQALDDYARANGGAYPTGEETSEASLSLLYPKYADANLLRGKTVPESEVAAILQRGKLLGPDTCGWYYVEGLTLTDDPQLALFWDKAGLGHNGQRLSPPGHYVLFLSSERRFIPDSDWDEFLQEQEQLLPARLKKSTPAPANASPN